MAMTREEFSILVKGMKAVYADPKFIPDDNAKEVWYRLLMDLDYDAANRALQRYIQTERFPPYPADIRRISADITEGPLPDASEAWARLRRALGNSAYGSREEFWKLDRISKRIVGSPQALREMMMLTNEALETVEKSNFLRSYRGIAAAERAELMASVKLAPAPLPCPEEKGRIAAPGPGGEGEAAGGRRDPSMEVPGGPEAPGREAAGMPEGKKGKLEELKRQLREIT